MYIRDYSRSYNGLGQADNQYNPPFWYNQIATDPTQVPAWTYMGPPPPGYFVGQRTFTQEDALRDARRRQAALEMKAEVSSEPEDKYLKPEGKLNPQSQLVMAEAIKLQAAAPQQDFSIEKRVLTSVILGAALSALLR